MAPSRAAFLVLASLALAASQTTWAQVDCSTVKQLDGYDVVPGDHEGDDLTYLPEESLTALASMCTSNCSCVAFNANGYLKSKADITVSVEVSGSCLYVKQQPVTCPSCPAIPGYDVWPGSDYNTDDVRGKKQYPTIGFTADHCSLNCDCAAFTFDSSQQGTGGALKQAADSSAPLVPSPTMCTYVKKTDGGAPDCFGCPAVTGYTATRGADHTGSDLYQTLDSVQYLAGNCTQLGCACASFNSNGWLKTSADVTDTAMKNVCFYTKDDFAAACLASSSPLLSPPANPQQSPSPTDAPSPSLPNPNSSPSPSPSPSPPPPGTSSSPAPSSPAAGSLLLQIQLACTRADLVSDTTLQASFDQQLVGAVAAFFKVDVARVRVGPLTTATGSGRRLLQRAVAATPRTAAKPAAAMSLTAGGISSRRLLQQGTAIPLRTSVTISHTSRQEQRAVLSTLATAPSQLLPAAMVRQFGVVPASVTITPSDSPGQPAPPSPGSPPSGPAGAPGGAIVGAICGVAAVVLIIVGAVVYYKRHVAPSKRLGHLNLEALHHLSQELLPGEQYQAFHDHVAPNYRWKDPQEELQDTTPTATTTATTTASSGASPVVAEGSERATSSSLGHGAAVQLAAAKVKSQMLLRPEEPVGRGAHSLVFQGEWQRRFGKGTLVAARLPLSLDEEVGERIRQQVRLLQGTSHSAHVVRMYAYCLEAPSMCLLLEPLPFSLAQALDSLDPQAQGTVARILQLARGVVAGLADLHVARAQLQQLGGDRQEGEVACGCMARPAVGRHHNGRHQPLRVITPASFRVDCAGVAKLASFGTELNGKAAPPAVRSYQAPESLVPGYEVDANQADMYSLGIIYTYMVNGRQPHEDKACDARMGRPRGAPEYSSSSQLWRPTLDFARFHSDQCSQGELDALSGLAEVVMELCEDAPQYRPDAASVRARLDGLLARLR